MRMRRLGLLFLCLPASTILWAVETTLSLRSSALPLLPDPVANNAVTAVTVDEVEYLVSFAGIGSGLKYSDSHARTFVHRNGDSDWAEQAPVPGGIGRLATTAASVGELAYVFGGYSVAEDGTEVSTPWVHSFDPVTGVFAELSPMPVPVDDAVSFTYQNRYIYLISGWHDLGNVNLVQRYDTVSNTWTQATPVPGTSLFGHAGGIVGNNIIYCDGVAVVPHADKSRSFAASDECWSGMINKGDSRRIDWRPLKSHPGPPRYRMAAAGIAAINSVLFLGGGENPYNYDGMGYDGNPSEPATHGLLFDLETSSWQVIRQDNAATMDHRGLVPFGDGWVVAGGMLAKQTTSDAVTRYLLR
jgi:Kelch motif